MLNFDWLAGIPLNVAKGIFLGLFVFIGLLVLMIPKSYVFEGVQKRRWWMNLKFWAFGLLVYIFIVYYIF